MRGNTYFPKAKRFLHHSYITTHFRKVKPFFELFPNFFHFVYYPAFRCTKSFINRLIPLPLSTFPQRQCGNRCRARVKVPPNFCFFAIIVPISQAVANWKLSCHAESQKLKTKTAPHLRSISCPEPFWVKAFASSALFLWYHFILYGFPPAKACICKRLQHGDPSQRRHSLREEFLRLRMTLNNNFAPHLSFWAAITPIEDDSITAKNLLYRTFID